MDKLSRVLVAVFGVSYAVMMLVGAVLLPASDATQAVVLAARGIDYLRGGFCLAVAGVCVHVVSGGLALLVEAHHAVSVTPAARPIEIRALGSLGTGVAALHTLTGVFYVSGRHMEAKIAVSLTSLVIAFFASFVALAFLRAGRAFVGYLAIAVGVAHGLMTVLTVVAATNIQEVATRGTPGALCTAAFAALMVILGFAVARGSD